MCDTAKELVNPVVSAGHQGRVEIVRRCGRILKKITCDAAQVKQKVDRQKLIPTIQPFQGPASVDPEELRIQNQLRCLLGLPSSESEVGKRR